MDIFRSSPDSDWFERGFDAERMNGGSLTMLPWRPIALPKTMGQAVVADRRMNSPSIPRSKISAGRRPATKIGVLMISRVIDNKPQ